MAAKKASKKATKRATKATEAEPEEPTATRRDQPQFPYQGVDLSALSQPGLHPPEGFTLPELVGPGALEPPEWDAQDMLDTYETTLLDKTICLNPRLAIALDLAETNLKAARELAYAQPSQRARWEAVEEAIHAYNAAALAAVSKSVKFEARGMPRPEYDELCMMPEHRPTRDHQDEWRDKCEREGITFSPLAWNPHAFPPALIAQCMVHPELDYDQAVAIWEGWSDAQAAVLFKLALSAQKVVY